MVEQRTENPRVPGSIPGPATPLDNQWLNPERGLKVTTKLQHFPKWEKYRKREKVKKPVLYLLNPGEDFTAPLDFFLLLFAGNKGTIAPLIRRLEEPERGVPKCL